MVHMRWIARRPRYGGQPEDLAFIWTAHGLWRFVMEPNSLGAPSGNNSGPGQLA
jgi:hypothetical protein